jgi:hypothetical protein
MLIDKMDRCYEKIERIKLSKAEPSKKEKLTKVYENKISHID